MIIFTSISPGHINYDIQQQAIESWKEFGNVYSMNTEKEIEQLSPVYKEVYFIKTDKVVTHLFDRPLVNINAMIDYVKGCGDDLLLINSDVILKGLPKLHQNGITIFSRFDYTEDISQSEMFIFGFDAFHIPYKFLKIFPHSIYALGSAWFDLSIPYRYIKNNIPVYCPLEKYAFHKKHDIQWDLVKWERIAEYFKWEFNLHRHLTGGQVATQVMNEIRAKLIHV